MTIRRIQCGSRMSQAVVHGGLVYLSGQVVPADAKAPTVAAQTRIVLGQIDRLLAEAGTSKERLVNVSIWLADIAKFDEMNEVWENWIVENAAPARATVEARLARPFYLVEIAAIAAV